MDTISGTRAGEGRQVDFFYSARLEAWVATMFVVTAAVEVAGSLIVSMSAIGKNVAKDRIELST